MSADLEIVAVGDVWLLEMVGAPDALSLYWSLDEAVDAGGRIARARGVNLLVRDGRSLRVD